VALMDELVKELRETSEHYAQASYNATADVLDQAASLIEEMNSMIIGLRSQLYGAERERDMALARLAAAPAPPVQGPGTVDVERTLELARRLSGGDVPNDDVALMGVRPVDWGSVDYLYDTGEVIPREVKP
jgi:hypothetical protein